MIQCHSLHRPCRLIVHINSHRHVHMHKHHTHTQSKIHKCFVLEFVVFSGVFQNYGQLWLGCKVHTICMCKLDLVCRQSIINNIERYRTDLSPCILWAWFPDARGQRRSLWGQTAGGQLHITPLASSFFSGSTVRILKFPGVRTRIFFLHPNGPAASIASHKLLSSHRSKKTQICLGYQ